MPTSLPSGQPAAPRSDSTTAVTTPEVQPSTGDLVKAWLVHAFTLTGFIWAILAVVALLDGNIALMWGWLGVALIVDGVDGSLARRYRVKQVVPWFNGTVVDHVVDYLTWTAIPVMFIVMYIPLGPRPLALTLAAVILTSSMFCYANDAAKSTDHYFVGFPAAWNIVAVLMWVWQAPPWLCIVTIILFSALTMVPLHYTHPFRVKEGRVGNLVATAVWIASTGGLIAAMVLPSVYRVMGGALPHAVLVGVNVLAGLWLVFGGLVRSWRGHARG